MFGGPVALTGEAEHDFDVVFGPGAAGEDAAEAHHHVVEFVLIAEAGGEAGFGPGVEHAFAEGVAGGAGSFGLELEAAVGDVEFVGAEEDGLGEVEAAVFGVGGDADPVGAEFEVVVAEAFVLGAEDEGDGGAGGGDVEELGGPVAGGAGLFAVEAVDAAGDGDGAAVGDGFGEGGGLGAVFVDGEGFEGHFPEFDLVEAGVGVDEGEVVEAAVFHGAADGADVAAVEGVDADDADILEGGAWGMHGGSLSFPRLARKCSLEFFALPNGGANSMDGGMRWICLLMLFFWGAAVAEEGAVLPVYRLVAPESMAEVPVERVRAWMASNLHYEVEVVRIPSWAGETAAEQAEALPAFAGEREVLVTVVMAERLEAGRHAVILPERMLGFMNVPLLLEEGTEAELRRLERQAMRIAGFSLGVPPQPMPFCALAPYGTMEELDRIGRGFSPPAMAQYRARLVALGIPLSPDAARLLPDVRVRFPDLPEMTPLEEEPN